MRIDQPVLRLARQGQQRLALAARELQVLQEDMQKGGDVLVEVLAAVRSLIDQLGEQEGRRRIVRASPELRKTAEQLEDSSRQIMATAEDLQQLLSGDF